MLCNQALIPSLEFSVLLHICNLKKQQYIPDRLLSQAKETADLIACEGDTLLYGGNFGDAAKVFNQVAVSIAVLSFQPGGIKVFGLHFESFFK